MTRVPELRFAGFDDDWVENKLGKEFKVQMGQSPNSANYVNDAKYPPLIKEMQILKITKYSYSNDILMTVRAPVGDIAINDQEVVIGRGICSITGSRFLYYNLEIKKLNNYWRKFSSGSIFESINSNDIKNSDIAIPYEAEQEKIGNLFKNIDQLIKNQEALVEETTNFKKSMLQKMFPKKDSLIPEIRFAGFNDEWKVFRLRDIEKTYTSISGKTKKDFGQGDARFITY